MRERLVAALARPDPTASTSASASTDLNNNGGNSSSSSSSLGNGLLNIFKKKSVPPTAVPPLPRTIGATLLADHTTSSTTTPPALDWHARARLLFDVIDTKGIGAVGHDDCARLVRDVLDGAAGVGAGAQGEAISDFLRELAEEGESVRESAVKEEVDEMMIHAQGNPPMLQFNGFAIWLKQFMLSIEKERLEEEIERKEEKMEQEDDEEKMEQEEKELYEKEEAGEEDEEIRRDAEVAPDTADNDTTEKKKTGFSGLFGVVKK